MAVFSPTSHGDESQEPIDLIAVAFTDAGGDKVMYLERNEGGELTPVSQVTAESRKRILIVLARRLKPTNKGDGELKDIQRKILGAGGGVVGFVSYISEVKEGENIKMYPMTTSNVRLFNDLVKQYDGYKVDPKRISDDDQCAFLNNGTRQYELSHSILRLSPLVIRTLWNIAVTNSELGKKNGGNNGKEKKETSDKPQARRSLTRQDSQEGQGFQINSRVVVGGVVVAALGLVGYCGLREPEFEWKPHVVAKIPKRFDDLAPYIQIPVGSGNQTRYALTHDVGSYMFMPAGSLLTLETDKIEPCAVSVMCQRGQSNEPILPLTQDRYQISSNQCNFVFIDTGDCKVKEL